MTGLPGFLLARYAEDEAVAQAAIAPPTMYPWGDKSLPQMAAADWPDAVRGYLGGPWGEHAAQWQPLRVLAECAAKRRIVEAEPKRWVSGPDAPGYTVDMGCPDGMVRVHGKLLGELEYRDRWMVPAPPSQTLLFLAMPYVEHPEFREEWRQGG